MYVSIQLYETEWRYVRLFSIMWDRETLCSSHFCYAKQRDDIRVSFQICEQTDLCLYLVCVSFRFCETERCVVCVSFLSCETERCYIRLIPIIWNRMMLYASHFCYMRGWDVIFVSFQLYETEIRYIRLYFFKNSNVND